MPKAIACGPRHAPLTMGVMGDGERTHDVFYNVKNDSKRSPSNTDTRMPHGKIKDRFAA